MATPDAMRFLAPPPGLEFQDDEELAKAEARAAELFPDECEDQQGMAARAVPPGLAETARAAAAEWPAQGSQPQQQQQQQKNAADGPTAAEWSAPGEDGDRATEMVTVFNSAGKSEQDMRLLVRMQTAKTAGGVLEAVGEALPTLSAEMAAEVVFLLARKPSGYNRGVPSNPCLPLLLEKMAWAPGKVESPKSLADLAWSLGKLDTRAHASSPPLPSGAEECMLRICRLLRPDMLASCTGQDLTNTLWGVARLFPGGASGAADHVKQVSFATHAIIRQCIQKVGDLTSQCLANSLWSMARLKIHGSDVEEYVRLAQGRMGSAHGLDSFAPQGLANVSWALAQLRLAGVGKDPKDEDMRLTLVALAEASVGRLPEFQAQELSMVAWSYAKLYEPLKGGPQGSAPRPHEVDHMLLKLAADATDRISTFEDQGISNIAWALATLELTGNAPAMAPARGFMMAAMTYCGAALSGYSAQAIANLIWACVRMEWTKTSGKSSRARDVGREFCSAVAAEMSARLMEPPANWRKDRRGGAVTATWRDLAGVAGALSRARLRSAPAMGFVSLLAQRAAESVLENSLTTQEMLNIAQAATRQQVPQVVMQRLVDSISVCIEMHGLRLNDVDKRQWGEVQQSCSPREDYSYRYEADLGGHRAPGREPCASQWPGMNMWPTVSGPPSWHARQPWAPWGWPVGAGLY